MEVIYREVMRMKRWKILLGILAFGSLWGMVECVLGSFSFGGFAKHFPMGALLGGLFGLGLMAYSRRLYGKLGMQLGMGVVAALLRFWSPVGTCVICSALAIAFESLVFEFIFNWKTTTLVKDGQKFKLTVAMLIPLGMIAGYTIYVSGYIFTQIMTPVLTAGSFVASDLMNVMPLILGRGFFAAVFGGIALPLAMLVNVPSVDIYRVTDKPYYATMISISAVCWVLVISLSLAGLLG